MAQYAQFMMYVPEVKDLACQLDRRRRDLYVHTSGHALGPTWIVQAGAGEARKPSLTGFLTSRGESRVATNWLCKNFQDCFGMTL